jgi:hypothetical protein
MSSITFIIFSPFSPFVEDYITDITFFQWLIRITTQIFN